MFVDKDGNFLLEPNLRRLARDICGATLFIGGSFVPVLEIDFREGMRREIATPHELFNALTLQFHWLMVANNYLKTQIPNRDVVESALDEAARRLRGG